MRIWISLPSTKLIIFFTLVFSPAVSLAAEAEFKTLRSDHFLINYQEAVSQDYLFKVKNTAEKFYRIITQEFNLIRDELWLWNNRAKVFIAGDKESYLKQFKCSSWSGACVDYRAKIIYTYPDQGSFNSIFIHELTHIILHEYIKKINLDNWLDEGVACYIENKYGRAMYQGRISGLKQAIKAKQYIPLKELLAGSSNLQAKPADYASLFYLESFSLINFFVKQYGKYSFSRFLSYLKHGETPLEAIAKSFSGLDSIEELEDRWVKFYLK